VATDVIGVIRGISDVATLNMPERDVVASRRHIVLGDGRCHSFIRSLWCTFCFDAVLTIYFVSHYYVLPS
jgi:hypothetical protein